MEFLKKAKETIDRYSMLSEGDHVLIGLSGGADSVCLTVILGKLQKDFNLGLSAVYVDHGLRPDETAGEESFCRTLCGTLGVEFHLKKIDVRGYAKEGKLNIQNAARELRYRVFGELLHEITASKIALGHNADDQAETFLMRLLRGSGQRGLSGIPPVRKLQLEVKSEKLRVNKNILIIRPLIEIERSEIEEFLFQNSSLFTFNSSLPFMVDSSNRKKDYFRNRLRLTIMLELKKQSPEFVRSAVRTADIIREEDEYLELIVTKTLMKLISRKGGDSIELFLSPLENIDKALLRRVFRRAVDSVEGLREIDFIHIEDVIRLVKKGRSGDRIYLPRGIRVIKGYSTLVFTSKNTGMKLPHCTFAVPGNLELKQAGIVLKAQMQEKIQDELSDGRSSAVFDFDKLQIPLEVRARGNGDYFYPAGFGKKRKLQDFFVDSKIPRDERDAVPVLISGKDIIWVVGHRADERFSAKEDTKKFLVVKVIPLQGTLE
ncbi:MAG: tRNA lysidine(34) synthetase TilS [Nitrospirae bacterium]|nr:tRNA lysidine(34) synthetase TilS [Nitrospirota bacterium]